ncbi:MAG: hypothetical protein FWD02_01080 [Bacteroidales bacterium]|nr:hypothetical protein [Bacteroidales bacterium]
MKPRVYIDTSIVGGYFDDIFEDATRPLFELLEGDEIVFIASDLLIDELRNAPESVKALFGKYMGRMEEVKNSDEAKDLAQKYIDEKVVGETSFDDCNHIAIATINNASILASWNFKHMVNFQRIQGYNDVNRKNGYTTLDIQSPNEIIKSFKTEKS